MYQFDFHALVREGLISNLVSGFVVTMQLATVSLIFSLLIGVAAGIAYWSGGRFMRAVLWLYIEFARNTPALVQLLFWYFSFAIIFPLSVVLIAREIGLSFFACVLALSLYHGAFMAEVVRSGLRSVPAGQYDAARSLGLTSFQMMRSVILPQAFRISLPPLINEVASLVKNTPLGIAIGVAEMTYQAKYIDVYYFRGTEALLIVTIVYFTLCALLSLVGKYLSKRLSIHSRGSLA